MMKKTLLTFTLLSQGFFLYGQVGINTENPQGIFNIDGGKDNPTTGSAHTATQQLNDFTVLANGNTGIGTIAPSQKLEIQTGGTNTTPVTGFKLADGNQSNGYVLTSDLDGVGTWKPSALKMYVGGFPDSQGAGNMPFALSTSWANTKGFITLPPGRYRIDLTILLKGKNYSTFDLPSADYCFYRFSLTESIDSAPTALTGDFYKVAIDGSINYGSTQFVSTTFYGPKAYNTNGDRTDKYAIAQGSFFVDNRTTGNKTYYVVAGSSKATADYDTSTQFYFERVGASMWSENAIMAFPLNY